MLDKALEKDRNLRYQTATELKTDLSPAQAGSRLRPPTRRRRSPAATRPPSAGGRLRRGALLRESQRREGRRVLPRRHHRRHHHRALEDQGPEDLPAADRAGVSRQVRDAAAGGPRALSARTCSAAACAAPATGFASRRSSWTRARTFPSGPNATTARWRTCSSCRTRSRARSPRRCASR